MKLLGFCTTGNHVRYVEVSSAEVARSTALRRMPEGECDSCRREREQRDDARRPESRRRGGTT